MLGRGVDIEIARRAADSFWGDCRPVLNSADLVVANLECAITPHATPWRETPKVFYFRAGPAATRVLSAGNVGLVSLANNHTLDFEVQGLVDTIRRLDSASIAHAGAGLSREEARRPAIVTAGDVRLGMISLTDNEPSFAAGDHTPGTYYARIRTDQESLGPLSRLVGDLRQEEVAPVVVALHWGPNMVERPSAHHQRFAHALIDAGADIVFGHSAHIFQAVEVYNRGLILYDTGDFLDDYAVDPILRNDWSFIFLVDTGRDGWKRLRLLPVRLEYSVVNLARGDDFDRITHRMEALCDQFGTPVVRTSWGLELSRWAA